MHAIVLLRQASGHRDPPDHFDREAATGQIPLDTLRVPVKMLAMTHKRPRAPITSGDVEQVSQGALGLNGGRQA